MNQPRSMQRLQSRHERIDGVMGATQQVMGQIAQLLQQTAQLMQVVVQTNQQIVQGLQAVAQTQAQTVQALRALSGPRRRVPIRDEEGRITEAHDLPMGMQ